MALLDTDGHDPAAEGPDPGSLAVALEPAFQSVTPMRPSRKGCQLVLASTTTPKASPGMAPAARHRTQVHAVLVDVRGRRPRGGGWPSSEEGSDGPKLDLGPVDGLAPCA